MGPKIGVLNWQNCREMGNFGFEKLGNLFMPESALLFQIA
jgi:hypothetical protein